MAAYPCVNMLFEKVTHDAQSETDLTRIQYIIIIAVYSYCIMHINIIVLSLYILNIIWTRDFTIEYSREWTGLSGGTKRKTKYDNNILYTSDKRPNPV